MSPQQLATAKSQSEDMPTGPHNSPWRGAAHMNTMSLWGLVHTEVEMIWPGVSIEERGL